MTRCVFLSYKDKEIALPSELLIMILAKTSTKMTTQMGICTMSHPEKFVYTTISCVCREWSAIANDRWTWQKYQIQQPRTEQVGS